MGIGCQHCWEHWSPEQWRYPSCLQLVKISGNRNGVLAENYLIKGIEILVLIYEEEKYINLGGIIF